MIPAFGTKGIVLTVGAVIHFEAFYNMELQATAITVFILWLGWIMEPLDLGSMVFNIVITAISTYIMTLAEKLN